MDSPEGEWAVDLLRVSRDWGRPPLTVLVGRVDVWREEDSLLGAALREYEATRLDEQGRPVRLSENPEHADSWDVDSETINFPQAKIDVWRKANPEPPPGTALRIVFQPTIRPEDR